MTGPSTEPGTAEVAVPSFWFPDDDLSTAVRLDPAPELELWEDAEAIEAAELHRRQHRRLVAGCALAAVVLWTGAGAAGVHAWHEIHPAFTVTQTGSIEGP